MCMGWHYRSHYSKETSVKSRTHNQCSKMPEKAKLEGMCSPALQISTHSARRGGSRLQSQHFGRLRLVDHEVKKSRPSWSTWWNPVTTKNTKISRAWWHTPVIPATREAKAGELPEPRRRRLQWAEIVPLHSSLGNKSKTPSQKKKREVLKNHLPWVSTYH